MYKYVTSKSGLAASTDPMPRCDIVCDAWANTHTQKKMELCKVRLLPSSTYSTYHWSLENAWICIKRRASLISLPTTNINNIGSYLWIWGVSKVDKFPLRSIDTECPRTSSETLTHILGTTKKHRIIWHQLRSININCLSTVYLYRMYMYVIYIYK